MATVEVSVTMAWRCGHCGGLVKQTEQMFKDGPHPVASHQCPDGTIETSFEDCVAFTEAHIVEMANLERSLILRDARAGYVT